MENYLYTCQYCSKQYKPNRRKKQKYCSNSCRTRSFMIKKGNCAILSVKNKNEDNPIKIEQMSLAGIGNAAAGTLAVTALTSLLTNTQDKPATKADINNLLHHITQRYYPILNLVPGKDGTKPFYDMDTKTIVYLKHAL